jgi:hypothetical protein
MSFPFDLTNAGIASFVASRRDNEAERAARYKRALDFYDAMTTPQKIDDPAAPDVKAAYCRKFAHVHSEFLSKGGFRIAPVDNPDTPDEDERERTAFIAHRIDAALHRNNRDSLLISSALQGSILGDSFFRLSWRDKPTDRWSPVTRESVVRVQVIPPGFCYPEFDEDGEMLALMIVWPRGTTIEGSTTRTPGSSVNRGMFSLGSGMRSIAESFERLNSPTIAKYGGDVHNDMQIEYWSRDSRVYYEGKEIRVERHNLGFIPVVHIPNYPRPNSVYGESDFEAVLNLQQSLDVNLTDLRDIISYHGAPTTVITGAAKDDELERGSDRLWFLADKDAKVTNLGLGLELAPSISFISMLRSMMHELAGLPEGILGTLDTGNSAVATLIRFIPLLNRREVKVSQYARGLQQVVAMMIRMYELKDPEFARRLADIPENLRYDMEVTFPNPMPREETIELDQSAKRIQLGISTRVHELVSRFGMSRHDAETLVDESKQERLDDAYIDLQATAGFGLAPRTKLLRHSDKGQQALANEIEGLAPKQNSGNPSPNRPNPVTQGEGVSRTASADAQRRGP